jgi:hypothetical protein
VPQRPTQMDADMVPTPGRQSAFVGVHRRLRLGRLDSPGLCDNLYV